MLNCGWILIRCSNYKHFKTSCALISQLKFQTTASEHIVELFAALDGLARALFLQGPPQMDTSVVSDNIAIVVMRPDCESRNQSITISSSSLEDPSSQNGESTLLLPLSVFGDSLEEDCRQVGVIAIVYGGAGPDLISLQEEFIPQSNCTPDPAPRAHGRWLVQL